MGFDPVLISLAGGAAFAAPAAAGDFTGVIGGVPGDRIALSFNGLLAYVATDERILRPLIPVRR